MRTTTNCDVNIWESSHTKIFVGVRLFFYAVGIDSSTLAFFFFLVALLASFSVLKIKINK